ncbi:hypothetical protein KVR01_007623 [Diaporthe batatas]|uniref:uncharacterized protein n=1 Tax=Diaporthe batatas TaxID=748121 RepID=UPI001D053D9C|nr:uncharacterized protein KVR01_007623 [Diaporthe batatas]KAG8163145.1 hypothetical protein KVR01_007623 [Diaporthe batatas]
MSVISEEVSRNWLHGSILPFAEPAWARGCPSPYYGDSHRRLREAMRSWVEKNLSPNIQGWEKTASIPDWIYEQAAKDGLLMPIAAGPSIPPEWKGKYPIIGDVSAEEWDGFHDLIVHDEIGRTGGIGLENGLFGGTVWVGKAATDVDSFNDKSVVHEVLSGKARIALAVTEPDAGSDVRGLQTEAVLSSDGSRLIINGQKKEDSGDFTLIVIPRTKGVSTRHMEISGSTTAGTAFVEFDDVEVPLDMVVGERGKGFKYIVSNFNHERLFIAMQSVRCARVCLEDSIGYALSRETFGKKLTEHPVIRLKFANMSRETEALQSWVESLIYQLGHLSKKEGEFLLAGTTAQVKAHSGIVLEHVVREAIQIMGGVGLTRGAGRGERVERIWRDVKAITVPGGSEEIMLDLATRRALAVTAELRKSRKDGKL